MEESTPKRLNYANRGAPEQRRQSDPYPTAADKWFLVIIISLLVFGGVMFAGACIVSSWAWNTPVMKVRLAYAFLATAPTLLTAATAMLLRPR